MLRIVLIKGKAHISTLQPLLETVQCIPRAYCCYHSTKGMKPVHSGFVATADFVTRQTW